MGMGTSTVSSMAAEMGCVGCVVLIVYRFAAWDACGQEKCFPGTGGDKRCWCFDWDGLRCLLRHWGEVIGLCGI